MAENGLPEIIRKTLSARRHVEIKDGFRPYRYASVLIPIFKEEGEYKILFTKRTNLVDAHKGQISFPGGRIDEEDASPEMTALREAEEEIGLKREDVEILGRTDDTLTVVSNFVVHPFVGLIPFPYDFMTNTFEVDRLLYVPFKAFLPDGVADRILPIEYEGAVVESLSYVHEGEVIWGATARIMKNFIQILGDSVKGL
ncbi:MAG: CoA pyrophosphatase [Desulfobacteraceae bacterium]|nr:MAG: CoA pyrophosphatase [Desulfobacteraceae bacterium]